MKRRLLLAAAGAPLLPAAAPAPLRVMTSFSILADLVREVGGDMVSVNSLVGPDADAHVYKPTPRDVRGIAAAEVVVVNGLGFEGWLERLLTASGTRAAVVVATEGIQPRLAGLSVDPHAWHDAALLQRYVATLAAALAKARPGAREVIAARARSYTDRLAAADADIRSRLSRVPREQRRVFTAHDAFGYFGAAYGVDFLSPQGPGTGHEPSAADVARLVRQLRRDRVRAVFAENIADARLIERIAREAGARVGRRLYSDALSGPAGPAPTCLKLFAHNADAICTAFGV
ncbi:metal ABC transporter solute-binding protein, Zn/Mn family [Roseateles sp. DC23W]|uniref:Metal ABC transporter solute-binding protein, Zn/Mn family n=1 Tax=Pelomonas dachongensis TaxID=3299029 RepID=A0ABW7ELE6_9BURK